MPFLIDGHNVIAALGDIDLEDPHDEAKLVLKLRAWSARVNRQAVVVFDGGIPGGHSASLSTADIKVIFAARHYSNADRIIRERLGKLSDAPNWTVVSSDREVLGEAERSGARTMTAQEFGDQLERPPKSESEKPDRMSAAELEEWLQIFPEPEETEPPRPPTANADRESTARPTKRRGRASRPQSSEQPLRHSRAIGEQLGMPVAPDPLPREPTEKPDQASQAEIDAWLEVFHDDPNREIPPPNLPSRQRRNEEPKKPVVRKGEGLTPGEAEAWLTVFGETESAPEETPQEPEEPRGRSDTKLARHREKYARADDQESADLSPEDLELWHRLFGDE
jgi:predicted RNA-binding protein with PIN domain